MLTDIERRYIPATELRVAGDAKSPVIEGYAAKFNARSQDLGGFTEVIAPGAFREALKTSDTLARYNHDSNFVIGRVSANTLTVEEDGTGLKMRAIPPDTQWARDLLVSIRRGDIKGQSFAFRVDKDSWEKRDGVIYRTIQSVKELMDVGPVALPAYLDTTVAARSLEEWQKASEVIIPAVDVEGILRYQRARLKNALALS